MSGNPFSVSAIEVATSAKMQNQATDLVLIVEGESDQMLIGGHVDRSSIGFVIAYGKNNALEAARILDTDTAAEGIRVLVDRDMDGTRGLGERAMCTKYWDLDAEVLASTKVLQQVFIALTQKRYPGTNQSLVRNVASASSPLASLLIVSQRDGLGIGTAGLSLSGIDRDSALEERVASIVNQAVSQGARRGNPFSGDLELLIKQVLDVAKSVSESFDEHQGHFLHISIASFIGKGVKPKLVQSVIWVALTLQQFRSTSVGEKLEAWAERVGVHIWTEPARAAA